MFFLEGRLSYVFSVLQQPPDGHGDAAGALSAQSLQQVLRGVPVNEGSHRDSSGRISADTRSTNLQISSSISGTIEVYENRSSGLSQDSGGPGGYEGRRGADQREEKTDGESGKVGRLADARRRMGGAFFELRLFR